MSLFGIKGLKRSEFHHNLLHYFYKLILFSSLRNNKNTLQHQEKHSLTFEFAFKNILDSAKRMLQDFFLSVMVYIPK